MDHRKTVHPSTRKCRNFPGTCTWASKCWYVHDEPMEVDPENVPTRAWNFKCNICGDEFIERADFMNHKKTNHDDTNLECESFKRGKCQKTAETCWFKHTTVNKQTTSPPHKQDFQKAVNLFPPEQLSKMFQMVNSLCQKVGKMEKRMEELLD